MTFKAQQSLAQAKPQASEPQAQNSPAKPQPHAAPGEHQDSTRPPAPSQGSVGKALAEASREAAGEEEENAQFKQSPSVRMIASITHLSLRSAYWLSIVFNFAILALLIVMFSRSKLPAMFRTRTGEIQRGITEARKASEDANRRLADIEARLARLGHEVAEMSSAAEREAAGEEARIQQAAEEDTHKIIEGASAEIAAAAKLARRELKTYTADLAVALAEKQIRIDPETDRALVSNFVEQLHEPGAPGKDGK